MCAFSISPFLTHFSSLSNEHQPIYSLDVSEKLKTTVEGYLRNLIQMLLCFTKYNSILNDDDDDDEEDNFPKK